VTPGAGDLEEVARLDEVTRRLRRDCPWDREQDARSIVPHTVEEAYELADAVARDDVDATVDELGDVLFQVLFLSLLLEERGEGSLGEVAAACREKLIRRHPHVYAPDESSPDDAGGVVRQWERIKRDVEAADSDPFATIPETLPALTYARKVLRRADPDSGGAQPRGEERAEAERAVGAALLEAVELSRSLGVDPELCLRAAANEVRSRASDSRQDQGE